MAFGAVLAVGVLFVTRGACVPTDEDLRGEWKLDAEIYVAARDLRAGEVIDPQLLARRKVPSAVLAGDELHVPGSDDLHRDALMGRVITVPLRRGDPVRLSNVGADHSVGAIACERELASIAPGTFRDDSVDQVRERARRAR